MKRLFCLCAALIVAVVPAFAVDSYSFYESEPVVSSDLSLLDYAVMPLAATSWDTSDHQFLADIRNAMVAGYSNATASSILGRLGSLLTNSNSIASDVDAIRVALEGNSASSIRGYLSDIDYNTEGVRTYISNLSLLSDITSTAVSILSETRSIETVANSILSDTAAIDTTTYGILGDTASIDSNVSSMTSNINDIWAYFTGRFLIGYDDSEGNPVSHPYQFREFLAWTGFQMSFDATPYYTGERTLYGRIKQLQEVLASDDDLALANSQKANREEIESSFLSGSSGGTSLGASDFGALSDVGGTIKDSISLNGQSSISGFTSGLSDADSSAQGWFSESTKNALDTVSSSASYDLRSDPYNMSGWQERYAWLEGGS